MHPRIGSLPKTQFPDWPSLNLLIGNVTRSIMSDWIYWKELEEKYSESYLFELLRTGLIIPYDINNHKIKKYADTTYPLVEMFRMADLIDVSLR